MSTKTDDHSTGDQTLPDPASGAKVTSAWFNTVTDLLNGLQQGYTEVGIDTAADNDDAYLEILFPRPYKAPSDDTDTSTYPVLIATAQRIGTTSHVVPINHWLTDSDGTFVGFTVRAWYDGNLNKSFPIRVHWAAFGELV